MGSVEDELMKMSGSYDGAAGFVRSIRPVRSCAQAGGLPFDPDADIASKVKWESTIEVHVIAADVGKHVVGRSVKQGLEIRDLE